MAWGYDRYPRYVSVAERARKAERKIKALRKKGEEIRPVVVEGRTIARTFWGKSWCDNIETYSDRSNRLSRGRSYVRSGSVIDLRLEEGKLIARVMGSEMYHARITIEPMDDEAWEELVETCRGEITSLVDLLQGVFPKSIMEKLCQREGGLFPRQREVSMRCSCPDGARMCKHLAAVLYGIGARLDAEPELLFELRQVDPQELFVADLEGLGSVAGEDDLHGEDLEALFGIDIDFDDDDMAVEGPNALEEREEELWLEACELIPESTQRAYTEAANILAQLRQLYIEHASLDDFREALAPILEMHRRKRNFLKALKNAGVEV